MLTNFLISVIMTVFVICMLTIIVLGIKREFSEPKNDWEKLIKEKEKRDLKEQKLNKKTIEIKNNNTTMKTIQLMAQNNTLKMEQKQILEKIDNLEKQILTEKENKDKRKNSYWQNIQKGKKYEYQIMQYFKNLGYGVYPKGFYEKKKDGGIDLIAHNEKEILIIQCKNWSNAPKSKEIRTFITDSEIYIKDSKNKNRIKDKQIRKIFVTSYEQIDYGVKCFLDKFNKENDIKIEYLIIPYNENI